MSDKSNPNNKNIPNTPVDKTENIDNNSKANKPTQKVESSTTKPVENKVVESKPVTTSASNPASDTKPSENKPSTNAENVIPEPKPAEKKTDTKTSLPPTPPGATKTNSSTPSPKQSEKKKDSKLTLLALLIALASVGLSIYSIVQNQKQPSIDIGSIEKTAAAAEQQALAAEKRSNDIAQTVEALQNHVANQAQSLDKAEVSQLIANALSDYAKTQAKPNNLSREDVEKMISSAALAQQTGTPSPELTQLLTQIRQQSEEAQNTLTQLNTRSNEIAAQLNNQAQTLAQQLNTQVQQLSSHLTTTIESRPNAQALINALLLANIAIQDGHYLTADKYLSMAEQAFTTDHLNNTALANYQSQISELKSAVSKLAGQGDPIADINNIINTIPAWPMKQSNHSQTKPTKANDTQNQTALQTAENIGTRILHRTFTIVHNDDSGLAWINAHPDLQILIRENVRLDLAFARNALQLRDMDSYKNTIDALIPRIKQYFDDNNDTVKNAINGLEKLSTRNTDELPDIATLIKNIQQATAKE